MEYTFFRPVERVQSELIETILNGNHVMISGATGSGKSVLINNIMQYLLYNNTPVDTQIVLIDPKRVELSYYKNLPFVVAFSTELNDIMDTLDRVISAMEVRYKSMELNKQVKYNGTRLIIVIDEIADLIDTGKKAFTERIKKIARLGRASNITLICATQSPNRHTLSADVVLNFLNRVGLHCDDKIESKQIISAYGCETLPKNGKCILKTPDGRKVYDIPFIEHETITPIVEFWEKQPLPPEFYKNETTEKSPSHLDGETIRNGCALFFGNIGNFFIMLIIVAFWVLVIWSLSQFK